LQQGTSGDGSAEQRHDQQGRAAGQALPPAAAARHGGLGARSAGELLVVIGESP